jgi:hypothetical protein
MLISKIKYDSVEYSKILIQWLVNSNIFFVIKMFHIHIVHIAYKHNSTQLIKEINIHPLAIVTAAVDRIGSNEQFCFLRFY